MPPPNFLGGGRSKNGRVTIVWCGRGGRGTMVGTSQTFFNFGVPGGGGGGIAVRGGGQCMSGYA